VKPHLLLALFFTLLALDVLANHLLTQTNCAYTIAARPEMPAGEIPLHLQIIPENSNC
jgi:hypothetical protein